MANKKKKKKESNGETIYSNGRHYFQIRKRKRYPLGLLENMPFMYYVTRQTFNQLKCCLDRWQGKVSFNEE